jgi:NADH:ubiquinone oxidoreductase subunit H
MSEGLLNSFSKAEYLMVFVAFVYSYIATLYFGGWARWLQDRREVSVSTNHVVFSVLVFLVMIDFLVDIISAWRCHDREFFTVSGVFAFATQHVCACFQYFSPRSLAS